MELEKYFDFRNEGSVLIMGTRVGIETVLRDYLEGASPEEIVLRYPALSLEQIHATITYYLANKEKLSEYLSKVRQNGEKAWEAQQSRSSSFIRSLREKIERERLKLHEEKPGLRTGVNG